MKTYLYKLSYNDGTAPCAPAPKPGATPFLTLALCKPAIRRTAQAGDRIIGATSQSLAHTRDYPLHAVIYAAIVSGSLDAHVYYAPRSPYRGRPDCIYQLNPKDGSFIHRGHTAVHADPISYGRDLGRAGSHNNGRILLSEDFRYFSPHPVVIPDRFHEIHDLITPLGQGHRVNHPASREREFDALFRYLWKQPTRHTPSVVAIETNPKRRKPAC